MGNAEYPKKYECYSSIQVQQIGAKMSKYVLVAETGSDIHQDTAQKYGIQTVPMHVNFAGQSKDDDSFPVEELYQNFDATGECPQTAGCSPADFARVFDRIHAEQPDAQIVYLAYSAQTTVSMQSAEIASQGRDYVTAFDTKAVSSGQRLVVTNVARWLEQNPDVSIQEIASFVADQAQRIRFAFMPGELKFLRAGGRLTNTAYLGATMLRIKPTIEVVDGRLVATKKRIGSIRKCMAELCESFCIHELKDLSRVNITYTSGDEPDPKVKSLCEKILKHHGAQEIEWVKSGGVIASHSGPHSFGIAALAAK